MNNCNYVYTKQPIWTSTSKNLCTYGVYIFAIISHMSQRLSLSRFTNSLAVRLCLYQALRSQANAQSTRCYTFIRFRYCCIFLCTPRKLCYCLRTMYFISPLNVLLFVDLPRFRHLQFAAPHAL